MNKLIVILLLCYSTQATAQKLYIYPSTVVAPRGTYQTVTAIVNGVNDKTVIWTASGGTLVGTNPCTANGPCTIALYTVTPGAYTLTATSKANHSVTATSTVTVTASPTPVTTHPRFLITQANLPALRAKATAGNVIYQAIRTQAIAAYDTDKAVWSWTCKSGTGLPSVDQRGKYKLQEAYLFAYMALIDPSDRTYNWGCYAHDVSISVMNEYMTNQTSTPHSWWFNVVCNPNCNPNPNANQNEWSDPVYGVALLPDFLLGSGAVASTGDIATLHAFLSYMAWVVLNAQGTPNPRYAYNSSQMFSPGSVWDLVGMRATGNNYNESRMLYLEASALTFNDNATDDPPLTNTCSATRYQVCPDFSAGSLHAYWKYYVGATLYNYWAGIEEPAVAQAAYNAFYSNLPTQPTCRSTDGLRHPCFGINREGESTEGSYYEYAMYRPIEAFNMLRTAGMDDPLLFGPQISATTSSFWDLKYISDLEFLTGPTLTSVSGIAQAPAYAFLDTGDTYQYWVTLWNAWADAALLTSDSESGRTDRASALKWLQFNSVFGGPSGKSWGCSSYCGYDYQITNGNFSSGSIFDMFISQPAGDPVASPTPDPRPSLPTDLFVGSLNQHLMVRNNWTQGSNTLFTYWFNNSLYNHEYNFDGRFDIFANGEYITKGRTIFNDYNFWMMVAYNQNELSVVNSIGTGGNSINFSQMFNNGGQMPESSQAGLVTVQHSELPGYIAAVSDTTNAYNGNSTGAGGAPYATYTDVQAASRSIVYLRGTNQVAFYDRARVGHAASTQAITQVTTGNPTISGNTADWLTRSGKQKAYFTSLLPSGGSLANIGLLCSAANSCSASWQGQDWEPASEIQVKPAGAPTSSQFLSVLEWGAAGFTKTSTTLVQSTSGQNFDGALVGSSLVMFMRNWPGTFTGMTYPASGATTQYISDLTPNTIYNISGAGAPASATTDTAGVLTFSAAGTGNITVGSATKIAATKSAPATKRAAVYAAGAVAAAVVLASYAARARASRNARAEAHRNLKDHSNIGMAKSLTAKRSLLDT